MQRVTSQKLIAANRAILQLTKCENFDSILLEQRECPTAERQALIDAVENPLPLGEGERFSAFQVSVIANRLSRLAAPDSDGYDYKVKHTQANDCT